MKTPRDLTGIELIKLLTQFGYEVVRQTGSHIRIQTIEGGEHAETIPRHNPIKIGALNNILKNKDYAELFWFLSRSCAR